MNTDVIKKFHILYYDSPTWRTNLTTWMGVVTWKCPFDLWIIQELLCQLKLDYIVETGTAYGGSALYYASIFDLLNHGQVITIDDNSSPFMTSKDIENRPKHPRITYIKGSSIDVNIVEQVISLCNGLNVMVVLDSFHSEPHVYSELQLYSPLVSKGSYIIVEDTNVNGNPVAPDHGPGPSEAVKKWLTKNPSFKVDSSCERLLMTFNPGGYLKRIF